MGVDFDLLGDPIPEGFGRRGRPAHVPSDEKRRLIMMLMAFDRTEEDMAAALGITPPTLRKHYFRELRAKREARFRVEAKLLTALMAEAEKGNVSAIDKFFKRIERHDLVRMGVPGRKTKEPKVGKKEQRILEAHRAGQDSGWNELLN